MTNVSQIFLLFLFTSCTHMCFCGVSEFENGSKFPTVGITVLVRNKAHTLPQFLTSLMNLDYPKDRIFLWFRSDYNIDNSIEILNEFIQKFGTLYNQVHFSYNSSLHQYDDEISPNHWSPDRYSNVIRWREWGVMFAKRQWADYVFMVDADVFFTNQLTLRQLVSKRFPVVAPMLVSDYYYSNFWLDMDENYSYQLNEDDDYINLYEYKEEFVGCHVVPMVYGAVLIDMRYHQADNLTYDPLKIPGYMGPEQDHIAFAINAKIYNITLRVCNDNNYGFINRPAREGAPLSEDVEHFTNLKLLAISRTTPLQLHYKLEHFVHYPPTEDYKVDGIYMINLDRRADKRHLMELAFKELGMNVSRRDAVDGRILNEKKLKEMNVTLMPGYQDPYHKRYLGRKVLLNKEEKRITPHLSIPLYSYWTIGYMLTGKGARKLLNAKPLTKLMPVDEFLPVMFNQHPDEKYNSYFPTRNLYAVSADPVIITPTHYTGMPGYISDTEQSAPLPQKEFNLAQNIKHMPHNLPRLPSQKLEF